MEGVRRSRWWSYDGRRRERREKRERERVGGRRGRGDVSLRSLESAYVA